MSRRTLRTPKKGKGAATAKATAKAALPTLVPRPDGRGALLTGGMPGNRGGYGVKDAFKEKLEAIRDEKGLGVLNEILSGEITYTLNGICSACGKPSTGPGTLGDVLKLVPSVDARMRGVDLTMRYTVGLEKTIRLEGLSGVRQAFDQIKTSIRAKLAPDDAESLILTIEEDLKSL